MSKEKQSKSIETKEETNSQVLSELQIELQKMRSELKELRELKKEFSESEKDAIEKAREDMLTDDDVGVLYIDPKYLDEENYSYTIADTTRVGRIEKRIKQGYEVVYEDAEIGSNTIKRTSRLAGAVTVQLGADMNDRIGVLMRIPREQYNKRQKAKHRRNEELTAGLMQDMANKSDFGSIEIGDQVYKK